MRRLAILTLIVFCIFSSLQSSAQTVSPIDHVRTMTDSAVEILSTETDSPNRQQKFQRLLFEYVDMQTVCKYVLIRSGEKNQHARWDAATAEEKREFCQLFGRLIERTFQNRIIGENPNLHGLEFRYSQQIDGNRAEVQMRVEREQKDPITADFWLSRRDGQWKVYNIAALGVNFAGNYRQQFSSKRFADKSVGELITILKEKISTW